MGNVYSNLKFLRYTDQLDALRERSVVAPVHVRIKPYNHCNHDCWYCAYRVSSLQLGEDINLKDVMPTDKMFEIVDDVIDMGVEAVTFSGGGEPMLYKPLPDVVERLAKGGVKVASLTNGSNLKGRMAEAFAEHATWVRVSVDAWDDASYSASRKIKDGMFIKLLENIRNFVATGTKCTLGISFIVSKDNHDHVFDACSQFKDAGVHHIKLSGAVISNDLDENNLYHGEIRDSVSAEIERAKALNDDSFEIINHYHELEGRFEKDYDICPFLQFLTVIGADCQVYTCQDKAFNAAGLLGSIKDRSFKEFWFSDENREALYALNPSKSCGHHCVAHAKNLAILGLLDMDPEHASFV
jgi:MoaA/NifB/PqqE/SkfB family radical SAM enzyme